MTGKKRASRSAPRREPANDLDQLNDSGNLDPGVVDERVEIRRRGGGEAYLWPDTFNRLSDEARALAEHLVDLVAERRRLAEQIDLLAPRLRRAGASWAQVGWCVGQTQQHARRRWDGGNVPR